MSSNLQVDNTLSATEQYVKDASGNASALALGTDGKVGIGTTAPAKTLELVYSTRKIEFDVTASSYPRMAFYGESMVINKDSNKHIYFGENADTGNYLFRGTGKMGIGTESPQENLHYHNSSALCNYYISTGTTPNGSYLGGMWFGSSYSSGYQRAGISSYAPSAWGAGDNPANLGFWTTADGAATATERMTIHDSGKVALGAISNPNSALHVHNNAGGTDKGFLTLQELAATGTPASDGQMTLYAKGSKMVLAMKVSGTVRYTSIDMSAAGNSWTTSTTTAP